MHMAAYECEEDDRPIDVAKKLNVDADALVALNKARYATLNKTSPLQKGTVLLLPLDEDVPTTTAAEGAGGRRSVVVFEEADVLLEHDKGFASALVQLLQTSQVPIVISCEAIPPPLQGLGLKTVAISFHARMYAVHSFMRGSSMCAYLFACENAGYFSTANRGRGVALGGHGRLITRTLGAAAADAAHETATTAAADWRTGVS